MATRIQNRIAHAAFALSLTTFSASSALAQSPGSESGSAGREAAPRASSEDSQVAIRAGYAIPYGSATLFGGQTTILADLGYKPNAHVFGGFYAGLGVGEALSLRAGPQVQFHFLPGHWVNPWLGYGIGLEWSRNASASLLGIEVAHFTAGVDVRIHRTFGLGPVIDLSLAQYRYVLTEAPGYPSSTPMDRALHQWVTIGARLVLLP